mmetsp:Transcript_53311/g.141291  ORF Transcript_53311/g.141291 Transcript_53311/m.141291 type:complete len:89 (-) Transcript_53311:1365-1631(-)
MLQVRNVHIWRLYVNQFSRPGTSRERIQQIAALFQGHFPSSPLPCVLPEFPSTWVFGTPPAHASLPAAFNDGKCSFEIPSAVDGSNNV